MTDKTFDVVKQDHDDPDSARTVAIYATPDAADDEAQALNRSLVPDSPVTYTVVGQEQ